MLATVELIPFCNDLGDEHLKHSILTLAEFRSDKNRKHSRRDADQNQVAFELGDYIYDGDLPRSWGKNTWYNGYHYSHDEVINLLAREWGHSCVVEIIQSACAWPLSSEEVINNTRYKFMVRTNLMHFMATGRLPTGALDAYIYYKDLVI